jgi:hypothetical protein
VGIAQRDQSELGTARSISNDLRIVRSRHGGFSAARDEDFAGTVALLRPALSLGRAIDTARRVLSDFTERRLDAIIDGTVPVDTDLNVAARSLKRLFYTTTRLKYSTVRHDLGRPYGYSPDQVADAEDRLVEQIGRSFLHWFESEGRLTLTARVETEDIAVRKACIRNAVERAQQARLLHEAMDVAAVAAERAVRERFGLLRLRGMTLHQLPTFSNEPWLMEALFRYAIFFSDPLEADAPQFAIQLLERTCGRISHLLGLAKADDRLLLAAALKRAHGSRDYFLLELNATDHGRALVGAWNELFARGVLGLEDVSVQSLARTFADIDEFAKIVGPKTRAFRRIILALHCTQLLSLLLRLDALGLMWLVLPLLNPKAHPVIIKRELTEILVDVSGTQG